MHGGAVLAAGVAAVLGDRGLAVGDQAHAVAAFFQEALHHHLVYRVVFGDKNARRVFAVAVHLPGRALVFAGRLFVKVVEGLAQGGNRQGLR